MAWSKGKTIKIFILVLLLSFLFAIASIGLTILNVSDGNEDNDSFTTSVIYFIATTFGTGLGCVWFRIFHSKMSWSHGIIHLLTFVLMLGGHRGMLSMPDDLVHRYCLCVLNIPLQIIQILLSIHLVVIRYGRSPAEKAFRSGLHAFLGALLFFICVSDGTLILHWIAKEEEQTDDIKSDAAVFCILLYAICTWYLILNPYFDWRTLSSFYKQPRSSKLILTIHLVLIRYGRTPAEKAFATGLHAFFGVLVFFLSVEDGLWALTKYTRDEGLTMNEEWDGAYFGALLYALCTFYLMLNSNFDWRRMKAMFPRPKPKILLSFHLVVFRSGRDSGEEAFRAGLHAFFGSLIFFECITDAICVLHRMSRDGWFNRDLWSDLAVFSSFFYAICTWYLILNPYFDWRRMNSLFMSHRPSKSESRKPYRRSSTTKPRNTGRSSKSKFSKK